MPVRWSWPSQLSQQRLKLGKYLTGTIIISRTIFKLWHSNLAWRLTCACHCSCSFRPWCKVTVAWQRGEISVELSRQQSMLGRLNYVSHDLDRDFENIYLAGLFLVIAPWPNSVSFPWVINLHHCSRATPEDGPTVAGFSSRQHWAVDRFHSHCDWHVSKDYIFIVFAVSSSVAMCV